MKVTGKRLVKGNWHITENIHKKFEGCSYAAMRGRVSQSSDGVILFPFVVMPWSRG